MTSFATELATPTVTDVRTDTLPRLIYKDKDVNHQPLNSYISRRTTSSWVCGYLQREALLVVCTADTCQCQCCKAHFLWQNAQWRPSVSGLLMTSDGMADGIQVARLWSHALGKNLSLKAVNHVNKINFSD